MSFFKSSAILRKLFFVSCIVFNHIASVFSLECLPLFALFAANISDGAFLAFVSITPFGEVKVFKALESFTSAAFSFVQHSQFLGQKKVFPFSYFMPFTFTAKHISVSVEMIKSSASKHCKLKYSKL